MITPARGTNSSRPKEFVKCANSSNRIRVKEERKRELGKKYVLGKETFTIEFEGKRRRKDHGRGIVCYWKGIYDGDWGMIGGIKVTYGKPIMRD